MRQAHSQFKDVVNSLVGKVVRFADQVRAEGKPLLTNEIEQAVKIGIAIQPATTET